MTTLPAFAQAFSHPESGAKYRKEFHLLAQECEQGNAVLPLSIVMRRYHDLYAIVIGGHPLSKDLDIHLVGNAENTVSHVRFRIFAANSGIWVTAQCPVDANGTEWIPGRLMEYKAPKSVSARR